MFLHALSDGLLVSHPRTKKHSHATSEVKLMIMRHTNLVRAEEDDFKSMPCQPPPLWVVWPSWSVRRSSPPTANKKDWKKKKVKMRDVVVPYYRTVLLVVFLNWCASALSKTLPGKQEWEAFQAKIFLVMHYRFIDFPFKRLTRDDELQKKDWLEMTSFQRKID